MLPKRWTVTYQLLPKVVDRLDKLSVILVNNSNMESSCESRKHTSITQNNNNNKYLSKTATIPSSSNTKNKK